MSITDTNKTLNYIYSDIARSISDFLEYVPAIIPENEDDEKTISIALDMVDQLRLAFKNSESIGELDRVIDVKALIDDYNNGSFRTLEQYSSESYDLVREVRANYIEEEED